MRVLLIEDDEKMASFVMLPGIDGLAIIDEIRRQQDSRRSENDMR